MDFNLGRQTLKPRTVPGQHDRKSRLLRQTSGSPVHGRSHAAVKGDAVGFVERRSACSFTMPAAVRVEGLSRSIGDRDVLKDVTFSVEGGTTTALVGANGAGKTSLLRTIATLMRPGGGTLVVLGSPLPAEAWRVRSRIGFVSHEPMLYSALTVRENLRFFGRMYSVPDCDRRLESLLDEVDLGERVDDPILDLSRGMIQRVALCRAMLHTPDLLLLDEPYSHLDPDAISALKGLIAARDGLTKIVVSHDLEPVLAEADRVVGLRNGEVAIDTSAPDTPASEIRSVLFDAR